MIVAELSLQSFVDRIAHGAPAIDELRELRQHPNMLVRANAIRALVAATEVPEAIEELVTAAEDPANQVLLMGTTRISHLAVESLYRTGTSEAIRAAETLLGHWPEPDRSDLLWYLRGEGHNVLRDIEFE